jgi:nucleoside-diphosphate-sugar epimerase
MKSKVLVTGGTGFIGRHVINSLRAAGWSVIATRRSQSLVNTNCADKDIVWWNIEKLGLDSLFNEYHEEIGAIIHIATAYDHQTGGEFKLFRTNVAFPMDILNQAILHKVELFINTDTFFNSLKVQYDHQHFYTLSKRHFFEWGKKIAESENIKFLNLVLHHVYGHGDAENKFISHLSRACLKGDEVKMTEGSQKRDFVYIKDVADAYLKVLENTIFSNTKGFKSFDIGTGHSISLREFSERLNNVFGNRAHLRFGVLPFRKGEAEECKADVSAITSIGWRPKYSLEKGLQEMFNNFNEELGL